METYRSLLPVALQWFETRDLHPNSAQLYGAEGDILLSPEKLMKLDGLSLCTHFSISTFTFFRVLETLRGFQEGFRKGL